MNFKLLLWQFNIVGAEDTKKNGFEDYQKVTNNLNNRALHFDTYN